jgi:predicted deoxyguanosinetriphosphate triphosphohydrolase
MDLELEEIAINEINRIEASKAFKRLVEKTQVLVPTTGRAEIVTTRFSHSYEVSSSARKMAIKIAKQLNANSIHDIDYQNCLIQACLLHDIGHPPFGHDGATYIDQELKARGLEEGFSDNNNNLVLIENQLLELRDYVIASTIKYPDKLYQDQKDKYLPKLDKAIQEDKEHFKNFGINLKNQKQTITCQIMDEADRNSYTCSDLTDFYCLGNSVELKDLEPFIDLNSQKQLLLAKQMVNAVQSGSKTKIKKFFLELKNQFNENWELTDNGLDYIDADLFQFRESLSKIEKEFFINPIRKEEFHRNNMLSLQLLTNNALDNGFCESEYYKDKIENANSKTEKLKAKRDMVAELSDWYVINNIQDTLDYSLKEKQDISQIKTKKRKIN